MKQSGSGSLLDTIRSQRIGAFTVAAGQRHVRRNATNLLAISNGTVGFPIAGSVIIKPTRETCEMNTQTKSNETGLKLIRPYDEQEWFSAVPGERLSIRVHSSDTNGKFAILESIAQPGTATPLHTHREDEVFQILEGEVVFSLGSNSISTLKQGDLILIPAGTPHAWRNKSNAPARMTAFFAPGGPEDLFRRIAGRSPEEIAAIAAEYGTVVVGPPIAE